MRRGQVPQSVKQAAGILITHYLAVADDIGVGYSFDCKEMTWDDRPLGDYEIVITRKAKP